MQQRPTDPPPLRAAAVMAAAGSVLVVSGFAVPDERWQLVAWILGGLVGGVGLLTLGYSRVEPYVPVRRRDERR